MTTSCRVDVNNKCGKSKNAISILEFLTASPVLLQFNIKEMVRISMEYFFFFISIL